MTSAPEQAGGLAPTYRIIVATEALRIGNDQNPATLSRKLLIRAIEPTDSVHYGFDPRVQKIRRVRRDFGISNSKLYAVDKAQHSLQLCLPEVLAPGEQTAIGYTATLGHLQSPTPEWLVQADKHGVGLLTLRLYFMSDVLPQNVYWTEWEPHAASGVAKPKPLQEQRVHLESAPEGYTMQTVRELGAITPHRTLGFRWEWGPPGYVPAATQHG